MELVDGEVPTNRRGSSAPLGLAGYGVVPARCRSQGACASLGPACVGRGSPIFLPCHGPSCLQHWERSVFCSPFSCLIFEADELMLK